MLRLTKKLQQRPENFRINPFAPMANGLVFAGLGFRGSDKTTHYRDSSHYGTNGTLTNMDPATDWVWSDYLGRWCVDLNGTTQRIAIPPLAGTLTRLTLLAFANCTASSGWRPILGDDGSAANGFILYPSLGRTYSSDNAGNKRTVTWGAGSAAEVQGWRAWGWRTDNVTSIVMFRDGVSQTAGYGAITPEFDFSVIDSIGDGEDEFQGQISDVLLWESALSDAAVSELSDPSNVMLSGLILPPSRVLFPVAVAAMPSTYTTLFSRGSTLIGGGVA